MSRELGRELERSIDLWISNMALVKNNKGMNLLRGNFFKFIIFFNFLTFIYFWDRERKEHEWGRVRDTESETVSRLWAVSTEPYAGLQLTDREIMTWAEVGHLTDWAPRRPYFLFIFRERERMGEEQRKRKTESQAGSSLPAQSPMQGSNSQTMRLWPEPKSWARHLTNWATQVPHWGAIFEWEEKAGDRMLGGPKLGDNGERALINKMES